MRRRDLLWLFSMSWLFGLDLFSHPAPARQEGSARARAAGRQLVRIPAPTFTLTDQEGFPFASYSWRGRVVVVTFGYTMCPDVCPLLAANLAVIQQGLPEAERLRSGFLFISTDPEHDSPAVLREYGMRLGIDFATWKFLTGSVAELRPVWRGFGVSVQQLRPGQVDHTTLTTIVDREGIRRVNYYGTRWVPQTLMDDLVALVRDGASGL